ncbi:NAD(P)-binding protein [Mycena epipterygia]|nr:NAD(P)-binding protein [Mycena epipterygia]
MAKKLILVTGATGRQGRALIHALQMGESDVGPEFHVWGLTRTVSSPAANELAAHNTQHFTVVQGNLDSPDSTRGRIWGVFCVLAFPGLGVIADGEEAQGKNLANISAEYGVSCFVFSSVERGGEYDDSPKIMSDRRAKVMIERHVRGLGESKGLPWTILRPGFFMENYEGAIGAIAVGVLKKGMKPTSTHQVVAVDDVGKVAAVVFKNSQDYASQILVIVGETSNVAQQQESYKKATGKPLPAIPGFLARPLIALNSHTKALVEDLERVHDAGISGKCPEVADQIAAAKRAYPDMKTFSAWAAERAGNSHSPGKNWNQLSIIRMVTGKL